MYICPLVMRAVTCTLCAACQVVYMPQKNIRFLPMRHLTPARPIAAKIAGSMGILQEV